MYDTFGVVGAIIPVTDLAWHYGDTWWYRDNGAGPSAAFIQADWFFPAGQSDALDPQGVTGTNGSADVQAMPVGTYVPEPAALGVLAVVALGVGRRRLA